MGSGIGCTGLCSSEKASKINQQNENKEDKNEEKQIDVLNEELLDINVSYIIIGLNRNFNHIQNPNTFHISLFLYSRYNSKKGIIMEFAHQIFGFLISTPYLRKWFPKA